MLKPYTDQSPRPPQDPGWEDHPVPGYHEVDAMWLTRWIDGSGWEPGQLYEHQGATLELSPGANVLHYGQAVFEGLKARRTREGKIVLFRPADNARRLRASASRLAMEAPPAAAFLEAIQEVVRANARWVPGYGKGSLYIHPILIGSAPVLGMEPAREYLFYVFASPMGQRRMGASSQLRGLPKALQSDSVKAVGARLRRAFPSLDRMLPGSRVIILPAVHRAAPHGIGAAKAAGNYAASLRPRQIATERGYVDALYLDAREDRYIEELSGANFFAIFRDGTLATPALGSILAGITRDSILAIAREVLGWTAVERQLAIDQVLNDAVEAFYTGTVAFVSPLTTINYQGIDHRIGDGKPGPRTLMLRQALNEIQLQERPDPWNWVTEVPT